MLLIGLGTVVPDLASAQLVGCDQVAPTNAPGGCIARTLEDQIDLGHNGDIVSPGTNFSISTGSIFLIKHDPARSIRRGRQLFQRKFTENEGQGPRVNDDSTGSIVANRALGAGMVDSCAGCHGRPRGAAGHGGVVQTFPDSRDSPHLFGLGLMEQLGDEMTATLRAIRQQAIDDALGADDSDCPVTRDLGAKGVDFGQITVACDGDVDYSAVAGVDAPSLRIKPFFAQGGTISMREFIIGAMNAEMGIKISDPVLCAVTDPDAPVAATSPSGFAFDPAADSFERPPVCDGSGELDVAAVDHLEFYLLNYFKPGRYLQTARSRAGLRLMENIGCTGCHIQNLTIDSDRRVADVETNFDPVNGIFNELFAVASTRFHTAPDPDHPDFVFVLPNGDPFVVENVFTDLKRHDLGPDFDERDWEDGDDPTSRLREHMTEPLWGVGSTSPYGHDGRSINLDAVIRRHGGEAAEVTAAFAGLSGNNQSKILEFLNTLVLFPPDDTASNLNAGDPSDPGFPQTGHGNIALGALFTIPSADIGPE
ncbi:MAG: di-heme oxidoredictase family protein [Thermoanaerobaculia bacterium]